MSQESNDIDQIDATRLFVGLTGAIGAGKSSVAKIFADSGIPVLEADAVARELMSSDREVIDAIRHIAGNAVYENGRLNRQRLAEVIFRDREKLERVNDVVHPRTIEEQTRRAEQLFEEGHAIVASEAALIFESGGEERFDYIVVVDAPADIRRQRAAKRLGVEVDEILRREEMQIPADEKVKHADFVIENDSTLDELERRTGIVIDLLKHLPARLALDANDGDDHVSNP